MNEILDEMDHRYRSNSILMSLLRSTMNNAHKEVRSVNGPIECLNEISKVYDLGIIQIDCCLKVIKEQNAHQIQETSQKKMLIDLSKLKDLLHGRLNYTKCLIIEKDKELMERLEKEFKLKQDLDLKEKELTEKIPNLADHFEPEFQSFEDNESKNKVDILIKQLSSDIDILKATLDLAYGLIKKAEVRLLDQQSRCSIEKEIILITIKGFIHNQRLVYFKNNKHNIFDNDVKKDSVIAILMEEKQESSLQTMTMEEHYMILLNECYNEFWGHEIERKVREDVFVNVLREVANDWSVYDANERIKMQLSDEIYKSVFVETVNDIRIKLGFEFKKFQQENLVYKKAFAQRCENLLLAETEVDLLGDQVEALQDLIRTIYFVLDQNSPVLSQNNQVMDILKLITKELSN